MATNDYDNENKGDVVHTDVEPSDSLPEDAIDGISDGVNGAEGADPLADSDSTEVEPAEELPVQQQDAASADAPEAEAVDGEADEVRLDATQPTEAIGGEATSVIEILPTVEETAVQPVVPEPTQVHEDDIRETPSVPMADVEEAGATQPNAMAGMVRRLLSTNAGRIGLGAVAAALVLAVLFGTHVICFHKWAEPTCTEPATCSICGRTQGEALGHDWQKATCTKPQTCSRCQVSEGKALGHSVTKWEVTTEPTCTKAGVESGKCDRCGEAQTREVPMVAHEFGDWKTTKEATCTEQGERTKTCKNCGKEETEVIGIVDHTPGDWVVTKQAEPKLGGGSTEGERTKSCTVCGTVLETESYTLSDEELKSSYIASCEYPSFEDVARYPDDWDGKKVGFTGEVIQVMQDGNEYTLRVNVTDTGYYWTDTIMVYYEAADGAPRVLEDDVMTFYGVMSGMYSYESIFGATITVPLLIAVYAE